MRLPTLTAVLAASLVASVAEAGVFLENTEKDLDGKDKPTVSKMWFDGGRMRTERVEPDGDSQILLFRSQALHMLDPKSKTYRVMDKATAERMGGQFAAAKKQMEARMAGMSPEQRAKMQEMIGKMGGGAALGGMGGKPSDRAVTKTARSETVSGIKCAIWEVTENGKKEQELCAAAPSAVPGGDEVMKTLREIGSMMSAFTEALASDGDDDQPWHDMDKINGVPILTRDFSDDGKPDSEVRLTAIRKESVPGTTFDVPAGYTEKKMPLGAGGQ